MPAGVLRLILSLMLFATFAYVVGSPERCSAQSAPVPAIRVETREVILTVRVIEEQKDPKGFLPGSNGGGLHVWIYHTQEVNGLSAKSFHVFEDSVEQRIQHFGVERPNGWVVTNNVGEHVEHSWTPSGIWSAPDKRTAIEPLRSVYLITYIPPPSARGSCHRIALKVDRRHATILAPDQYCNTKFPLSDPLSGTPVGNTLLQYASSREANNIPIALQLTAFSGSSNTARINVSVEMPANLLKREWKANQLHMSVGIVGLVYDKDHRLVDRFSDTVCPSPECGIWHDGPVAPGNASIAPLTEMLRNMEEFAVPSAYRTQLELEPGDYEVELVITDGEKFGRADASVRVDDFQRDAFGISGIALCKQYHRPSVDERGPTRAPQYVPLMYDGQEFTPAGDTRFKTGDQFMAYLEIYSNSQSDAATAREFHLEMKVWDANSGELKVGTGLRPVNSAKSDKSGTVRVGWTLAIDKLPAGSYRLQARASDSAGHTTEWREKSFSVD